MLHVERVSDVCVGGWPVAAITLRKADSVGAGQDSASLGEHADGRRPERGQVGRQILLEGAPALVGRDKRLAAPVFVERKGWLRRAVHKYVGLCRIKSD